MGSSAPPIIQSNIYFTIPISETVLQLSWPPYQTIYHIGTVAYKLCLPPSSHVHLVFHATLHHRFKGPPPLSPPPLTLIENTIFTNTPFDKIETPFSNTHQAPSHVSKIGSSIPNPNSTCPPTQPIMSLPTWLHHH